MSGDTGRRGFEGQSRTAYLRHMRATFIAEKVKFHHSLSIDMTVLRKAFQEWIEEPDETFNASNIGDLYAELVGMGAVKDEKGRRFYNIGL